MIESRFPTAPDDLVIIARNASLYDWLIGLTRRDPQPLPPNLGGDFGLPPPAGEPLRGDWRGLRCNDG